MKTETKANNERAIGWTPRNGNNVHKRQSRDANKHRLFDAYERKISVSKTIIQ